MTTSPTEPSSTEQIVITGTAALVASPARHDGEGVVRIAGAARAAAERQP